MRLRTQLLGLGLIVLILPWGGCQYIRQMEQFLREAQAATTQAAAQATARVVADAVHLSSTYSENGDVIYAHRLKRNIVLDGYTNDWEDLLPWSTPISGNSKQLAATDERFLYVLLQVTDDNILYQRTLSDKLEQSDHINLVFEDDTGTRKRIAIASPAPGWVIGQDITQSNDETIPYTEEELAMLPDDPELALPNREARVRGEWQESEVGYTVELRLPLDWIGSRLGIEVIDVDRRDATAVQTTPESAGLATLILPQASLSQELNDIKPDGMRVWVLNPQGYVLARAGRLEDNRPEDVEAIAGYWLSWLYRLLLNETSDDPVNRPSTIPQLLGPEIDAAINAKPGFHWWRTGNQNRAIVSATYPIELNNSHVGIIVAEQAASSIALLTNKAMTRLLGLTLLIMLIIFAATLGFATYLTLRIRRLRNAAENAITADGRISEQLPLSSAKDELGDLARSYSALLGNLRDYTEYLRTLASKLSHELRTPLAVLQSSLDNLSDDSLPPDAKTYTERAREGAARLNNILNAMSEATRMEQAIGNAEPEAFELRNVVAGCAEGYKDVYKNKQFEIKLCDDTCSMTGVPDLIAQMLDKLVDNAADFAPDGGTISIALYCDDNEAILSVANQGPPLPDHMQGRLFDSMVSLREEKDERPHLGLGLYIVRLIAEFHGGHVEAENIEDKKGVIFNAIMKRVAPLQ